MRAETYTATLACDVVGEVMKDVNGKTVHLDCSWATESTVQIRPLGGTAIGSAVATVRVGQNVVAMQDTPSSATTLSSGTLYVRAIDVSGDSLLTVVCSTVQAGVKLEVLIGLYDVQA